MDHPRVVAAVAPSAARLTDPMQLVVTDPPQV